MLDSAASTAANASPPTRNSVFMLPDSSMVRKPMTEITRMAAK